MTVFSPHIIQAFCRLCNDAYESWLHHIELFDQNPHKTELSNSFAHDELLRLSEISQEYALLQIVKLHDPTIVAGKMTLGIDTIFQYGGWPTNTQAKLESLLPKQEALPKKLRSARNKVLSHNDLAAIAADLPLGRFEKGEDIEYFKALQEFVDIVHDEVVGGPYPFNDLVKNDVDAFNQILLLGIRTPDQPT